MPAIYDNTTKAARMTATRDIFAGGSLEILAADNTLLLIYTLSGSGGTISGDIWTLAFITTTAAGQPGAGTGTVATKAQLKTAAGAPRMTGLTVGVLGTNDVIVDNASVAATQHVTLNTMTIIHAT